MCTDTQPTCIYQLANTALKFVEDEGDTLSQDVSSREHRHSLKDETGIHKMSAAKEAGLKETEKGISHTETFDKCGHIQI